MHRVNPSDHNQMGSVIKNARPDE
jgi:hypothetical protein